MVKFLALGLFTNAVPSKGAAVMCLAGPGARLPPAETWRQQRRAAEALKAEVFLLLSFKGVDDMNKENPADAHWVKEVYHAYDGRGRQSLVSDYHRFAQNGSILEDYKEIPGRPSKGATLSTYETCGIVMSSSLKRRNVGAIPSTIGFGRGWTGTG